MAPSQVVGAVTQTGSGAWILIGWVALAIAFASAAVILWDIAVRGYRQHMAVMNGCGRSLRSIGVRWPCGSTSGVASR
jgi:hypothetical protein